ncbi:MAG: hypothetical protein COB53_12515 [Elusimicrobia bacterium]|nr:MAG: hypothetical protein COB53_12515 [Elusimicrobiota bacterium]
MRTNLTLALLLAVPITGSAAEDHADGTSIAEIESALQQRPELRKKQRAFEERLKRELEILERTARIIAASISINAAAYPMKAKHQPYSLV